MNSSDITNRLAEVGFEQAYESEFSIAHVLSSEQGPFVAHLLQDIVVKSKPLGLDFYKAASCQQRHHGFFPVRQGIVLSYCMGNLMFFEASTGDASNYSNSEGSRRRERFESSFISKTLLATLTQ